MAGVLKTMESRRADLARLRVEDYKYYEYVLERLNIVYKPLPVFEHKIRRKECIRRLASEYVLLLKKERRAAYAAELEQLKEPFLAEKVEKLRCVLRLTTLRYSVYYSPHFHFLRTTPHKLSTMNFKSEKKLGSS
jgi:hypothetical protein